MTKTDNVVLDYLFHIRGASDAMRQDIPVGA